MCQEGVPRTRPRRAHFPSSGKYPPQGLGSTSPTAHYLRGSSLRPQESTKRTSGKSPPSPGLGFTIPAAHYFKGFSFVPGRVFLYIYSHGRQSVISQGLLEKGEGGKCPPIGMGFIGPTAHYLKGFPFVPGGRAKDTS